VVVSSASCVAPPSAKVEADHGLVRAPTPEEAERVAGMLDELLPEIRRVLPGTTSPHVEVWLQDELRLFWLMRPSREVVALNYGAWNRIHLLRSSSYLPEDLTHELVHLMLGPDWKSLPPVLVEGLADHVGLVLHPRVASRFRAGRLLRALAALGDVEGRIRFARPLPNGGQQLTFRILDGYDPPVEPHDVFRSEVQEISPHSRADSKRELYGLGFFVVSRLYDRYGYDGLLRLCRAASDRGEPFVAAGDLAHAAFLWDDGQSWRRAILAELGPDEVRVVALHHAQVLAGLLAQVAAQEVPDLDVERFLTRYRPRFAIEDCSVATRLDREPAVRALLVEEWISAVSAEVR